MDIDLDLYRHELRVSSDPLVRLSAVDISPERPERTFVFIHGFGGQAMQWQYQLHKFALKNRVIALDMRGHGLSDKPSTGYDMPRIQLDLETALDLLKVSTPIVLVGHSFGGAIATDFALNHPERVERLILIATAGEFKLSPLFKLGLNLPTWSLRVIGPFTRKWLSGPPHALKPFYLTNLSRWVGWDKFAKLNVPTLVIRGHRDVVFERPLFEKVAGSIVGADEEDIGVSGHMVMLERREAVNRAISRFLGGESKKSWRDDSPVESKSERDELPVERPWLKHYEEGVPYTIGIPRIPLHHLLRSAVRRFPNRAAIYFEGAQLSYRKLNHEANRFANALTALGIGKGARVVLYLPNIPQAVIAFYGVIKAGAVAVFTPPMTDAEELTRQVKIVEARALVTLNLWAGMAGQVQQNSGLPLLVLTDAGEYLAPPKRLISRWRNRGLNVAGAMHFRRWISGQSDQSPNELLGGKVSVNRLREVDITDLLRREPVRVNDEKVGQVLEGRRVLVTGAGGSIGSELCRQIARRNPAELVLLGHGENSIFEILLELQSNYSSLKLIPIIADIRNAQRLDSVFATYQPQIVFHAAAHKHVPLMEANPVEAITNNVIGTRNLVQAALDHNIERFVLISTDKAVRPSSIYGATKRLAEMIVLDAAHQNNRAFTVVRFGNVLGSRGSIIPIFKNQIANGGPITITHPDMVRFFMTIPEAVYLVLQASSMQSGGEVFVLNMGEPVRILDLAEDLIKLSGLEPHKDIEITFTGIRPGEKLAEELWDEGTPLMQTPHPDIFRLDQDASLPTLSLTQSIEQLTTLSLSANRDALNKFIDSLIPGSAISEAQPSNLQLSTLDF